MNWLTRKWKRFWCKHTTGFFRRNIYGEEINYANARSVYQCADCGKYIYKQELNQAEEAKTIDFLHTVQTMPVNMQRWLAEQAGISDEVIVRDWTKNQETQYEL